MACLTVGRGGGDVAGTFLVLVVLGPGEGRGGIVVSSVK